jgi:hypothetical protein
MVEVAASMTDVAKANAARSNLPEAYPPGDKDAHPLARRASEG